MPNDNNKIQCQGIKLNGKRCTRPISPGKKYCWQHAFSRRNDSLWYTNSRLHFVFGLITTTAFVFSIFVWRTGPTISNQKTIIGLLEKSLSLQDKIIVSQQTPPTPSVKAKKYADQIPDNAKPYSKALKAIALQRFDEGRSLLDKAQRYPDATQSKIYNARAELEFYAGNYKDAADWHEKAMNLSPDDRQIWQSEAYSFYYAAQYDKAEPLLRRALEIDEASFGPDHPNVAICLNNLALLLRSTYRLTEAEPLYRRALKIDEASLGTYHPDVARDLNNLAELLTGTNRLDEAEPLFRRALNIFEDSLGPDHPKKELVRSNLRKLQIIQNIPKPPTLTSAPTSDVRKETSEDNEKPDPPTAD